MDALDVLLLHRRRDLAQGLAPAPAAHADAALGDGEYRELADEDIAPLGRVAMALELDLLLHEYRTLPVPVVLERDVVHDQYAV